MEEAPGAEEGPASRAAAKKRSREDRDTDGASIPPSGLDAWAEEATANRGGAGAASSRGGDQSPPGGDAAPASHVKFGDANGGGRDANGRQRQCFRYGNYHRYYGYRVGESLEDHRIAHLKREWFHGKRCVDVGCNEGLVSLSIAVSFGSTTMLGIDIDQWLVKKAREKLRRMRRAAAKAAARLERESEEAARAAADASAREADASAGGTLRSHPATRVAAADAAARETTDDGGSPRLADSGPSLGGVTFRAGNILDETFEPGSVDAFLCLSVTKWIQLNWGDAGLKKMFKQIYDALSPGGVFIVEPQPWKSYKRAFRKQKMPEETRAHFRGIELRPAFFAEHLRAVVGFSSVQAIRSADLHVADEFDRNLLLCVK